MEDLQTGCFSKESLLFCKIPSVKMNWWVVDEVLLLLLFIAIITF